MKVYTKTGDKGETQVYADKPLRLSKDDHILECYGTLDELNANIGLLIAKTDAQSFTETLTNIQQRLFQIGFAISATSNVTDDDIEALEKQIDAMQEQMPAQTTFILPGGTEAAAQAHVCRTIARRAERRLVTVSEQNDVPASCLAYVNRLSDYCFVLARYLNHQAGVEEHKV